MAADSVNTWREWWQGLELFDEHVQQIVEFLGSEGYFESDGDFLLIGREAERKFGPRTLLLAGCAWEVTSIDWARRRCQVEPSETPGGAKWGFGTSGLSFDVTRAMRDVVPGADLPGVTFTRRASDALAKTELRDPGVNKAAVAGLKFSAAIPEHLAIDTIATRLADHMHARRVLNEVLR